MSNCKRRGCPMPATHHLGVRVWPHGVSQSKTRPFTGLIGLELCRAHATEAVSNPHLVVTEAAWGSIAHVLAANSPVQPDRDTLELFSIKGAPPALSRQAVSAARN